VDRLSPDIATSQPTQQVALPLMGQVAPIQPGMPTSVGKPPGTGSVHDGKRLPHGLPASLTRAALRANKDEKVELTLDPIELGKVRFDFSTTGDRMHVNLSVERGDTLDLLRRNADQLRAEFRDAGFDSSSLSFSQWTQQGGDNRTAEAAFDDPDMAEFDLAQPEATPNRNKTSTGHGLDLRL